MNKEEKIEALKYAKKVLQEKIDIIDQDELVQTFGSCPPGQIRNAQGTCVDRLD